jgi:hypothetical protein
LEMESLKLFAWAGLRCQSADLSLPSSMYVFGGTGIWTKTLLSFALARQAPYHLSYTSSPFNHF